MTGYGDARQQSGERLVAAEVRTVNNRYLKVNLRCPDSYAPIESEIERLIRNRIARGTVSLTLRAETLGQAGRCRIDRDVLIAYWEQMTSLSDHLGIAPPQEIASLLELPGVLSEQGGEEVDPEAEWPLIESVVESALAQLDTFRRREGESMARDLAQQCQSIRQQLGVVTERAPSTAATSTKRSCGWGAIWTSSTNACKGPSRRAANSSFSVRKCSARSIRSDPSPTTWTSPMRWSR
jgi:uncharacterized protein (TIGR00255 family)